MIFAFSHILLFNERYCTQVFILKIILPIIWLAFNATAKLYVDAYPGFSGFVEHSALSFDDKIILFGGSSNFALSNSISAYRPGICFLFVLVSNRPHRQGSHLFVASLLTNPFDQPFVASRVGLSKVPLLLRFLMMEAPKQIISRTQIACGSFPMQRTCLCHMS